MSGLNVYMSELTVMPPSWDNNIRLEPPKTSQTPMSRLIARAEAKEKRKKTPEDNSEDDEDDNENSHLITNEEKDHTEDESLQFTGRLFGGLILDVKRKLPWFVSDFKDALHIQTLASIIYIYLGRLVILYFMHPFIIMNAFTPS